MIIQFFAAVCVGTAVSVLLLFMVSLGRVGSDPGAFGYGSYALLAVQHSIIPGWLFAVVITLFSALHHLRHGAAALLLYFLVGWAVLFGGLSAGNAIQKSLKEPDLMRRLHPRAGMLYQSGERAFVAGDISGYTVQNMFLYDRQSVAPRWHTISQSLIDPYENSVRIPSAPPLLLENADAGRWSLYHPPALIAGVLRDAVKTAELFYADSRLIRVLLSFAAAAALFSLWTLARLTRWPLLNSVLVFAALRFFAWAGYLVQLDDFQQVMEIVFGASQSWLGISLVFAVVAIILTAIGLLLPPFHSWDQEAARES